MPQKEVLLRFVDVEANEADAARLIEELFANPELQPDHRLLTWFCSRLGAYDQVIAVLQARLAKGRHVDAPPLWGPGTLLNRQPDFLELADAISLLFQTPASDGTRAEAPCKFAHPIRSRIIAIP